MQILTCDDMHIHVAVCALCSVPELRFIEPQGLTSDHVKELTEEVEKLAKEKVGEVRKRGGERERKREREREREKERKSITSFCYCVPFRCLIR